jgi:ferredoxin
MKQKTMKIIRVIISLLMFLLILFCFTGLPDFFPAGLVRGIIWLQFIPSLLGFAGMATVASAGFIVVILLTLLFGRVYCSFLCPLGTLQDMVTGIRTRLNRHHQFRFKKSRTFLRFLILAVTILCLFFGNIFLLTWLDPFSMTGKFFTLPEQVFAANHSWTERFPLKWTMMVTGSALLTILFLAFYKGRWYCNAICPAGTFLGLFSRVSLYQVRTDPDLCRSCGTCSRVCKAGCIDFSLQKLDFSRCVGCFNCVAKCPAGGIGYRRTRFMKKQPDQAVTSGSRRNFLKTSVLAAAMFSLPGKIIPQTEESAPVIPGRYPATPPGSLGFRNYTAKCTACQLCVAACPAKVLQPSFLEFGLTGMFQPKMDYYSGFCLYECNVCSEICPTGAIQSVDPEQKQRIQIGNSRLDMNICVVVADRKACGLCAEKCPTKAIGLISYLGDLKLPELNSEVCIGCGHCEFVCPTRPLRAIYVEPLAMHRVAMPAKK